MSDQGTQYPFKQWKPLVAILTDWLIIFASAYVAQALENPIVTLASLVIIASRQHALFVLIHEAVHFNLSRNKFLNEFLSDYLCAFPVLFDTFAYRRNHLAHHRHLNTDKDPDWARKVGHREWTFPVTKAQVVKFLPYFIFLKGPYEWSYIVYKFSGFAEKERWKLHPAKLLGKLVFFCAFVSLTYKLNLALPVLFYWAVPLFFIFPLIQRLRSASEHFSLPYESDLTSSRDVKTSWLEGFLLSPHNVNYHLVHHSHPHIPFASLPAAFALLKNGELKEAYLNTSYLFPYSGSVLEDFIRGPHKQTKQSNVA